MQQWAVLIVLPIAFNFAERWLICDDPSLLRLSIVQVNFTMRSA